MIAQFSVGNFLSFKETYSLNFEATPLKDTSENIYCSSFAEGSYKLLKSISIHGSNSAGKSNLLKGFTFMKYWVINSFNESNRILEIPVTPFLLRETFDKKNSFFEVVFYINEIRYRYGFELNKNSIDVEWLYYSQPKKREQNYFVRKGQEIGFNNSWKKNLSIKLDPIILYVKPRVLFISVLGQFNIDIGNLTIDWFNKNLIGFDFSDDYFINSTAELLNDSEYFVAIHHLIKMAKLGFESVEQSASGKYTKNEKFDKDFIAMALAEDSQEYVIQTRHYVYNEKNKVSKPIYFDLKKQESSGSQKFFAMAGSLLKAIREKQILWIDELDSKFHPLLFQTIIKFFNSNKFNHRGAQLVFSTHNTQLLKEKLLRRDQIFTIDKNEYGESEIKGMHTSNVRIDASYEKLYLDGKYGGVQKLDLDSMQLGLFEE